MASETTPVGAYDPDPEAGWLEFQESVDLPLPSPYGSPVLSVHLPAAGSSDGCLAALPLLWQGKVMWCLSEGTRKG